MGNAIAEPVGGPERRTTSEYGIRSDPISAELAFHGGVHIAAARGGSIHAAAAGDVILSVGAVTSVSSPTSRMENSSARTRICSDRPSKEARKLPPATCLRRSN